MWYKHAFGEKMSEVHRTFTSESVTQGHPYKVVDSISDVILDETWQATSIHMSHAKSCVPNFFMFACEISSACYSWNQQESVVGRFAENIRPPTPIQPYVSYLNKTLNFKKIRD